MAEIRLTFAGDEAGRKVKAAYIGPDGVIDAGAGAPFSFSLTGEDYIGAPRMITLATTDADILRLSFNAYQQRV